MMHTTNEKQLKQVHAYIPYDEWFLISQSNKKWIDVVRTGIRVLAGRIDTKKEIEQRIELAKEIINQKEREITFWNEKITELAQIEVKEAEIKEKKVLMEF